MPEFADFTRQDIERILEIVDRLGDVEIEFQSGDIRLLVHKSSSVACAPPADGAGRAAQRGTSAAAPDTTAVAVPGTMPTVPEGASAIRAPMLGRFFRAPSPNDAPFVEVGAHVEPDDPVAIIEVMKLFHTVRAGVRGTITAICKENAAMVEFDEPLFVVSG